MLNFSLSGPTCYTFMQYYLTYLKPTAADDDDGDFKCLTVLTNYLCTLSLLQDRPFASYRASMIAAGCLLYARRLLDEEASWNDTLVQVTSFTQRDLSGCVAGIDDLYRKTFQQEQSSSSILRRYLKARKENEGCYHRVRAIIHQSLPSAKFGEREDDDDDEILDLTLDDIDEENMSMEHR